MERCLQKAEDRYNELVLASEHREEAVRSEMQSEMAEVKRGSMASSLVQVESLKKRASELEFQNRALEVDLRRAGFKINKLKGDVSRLEKDNTQSREQAEADREELNRLRR
jgi:ketol-acid reductoisomerase